MVHLFGSIGDWETHGVRFAFFDIWLFQFRGCAFVFPCLVVNHCMQGSWSGLGVVLLKSAYLDFR